jgi:hypothetical protein
VVVVLPDPRPTVKVRSVVEPSVTVPCVAATVTRRWSAGAASPSSTKIAFGPWNVNQLPGPPVEVAVMESGAVMRGASFSAATSIETVTGAEVSWPSETV